MEEKTLFYATGNKSKLHNMVYRLRNYPVRVLCPDDLGLHVEVEENGATVVENALLKARAYAEVVKLPVITGDSGLSIQGLPDDKQPGLYVRRVNGKVLSDDEMIAYYAGLAEAADTECTVVYDTGIAMITAQGEFTTVFHDAPLRLTATPNANRNHNGNPLDCITQTEGGKYFNDLTDSERAALTADEEARFTDFVVSHLQ